MRKYDLIVFSGGAYAYAPVRIREEARKAGYSCLRANYKDIRLKISDTDLSVKFRKDSLPLARGVFLRALGEETAYNALKAYLLHYYQENKVRVLNSRSFLRWISLDKTTQYLELKKAGIPLVPSWFFGSKIKMLAWAKGKKMPLIVKENVGSLGTAVFKVNSVKALEKLLENYSILTVKTLLVQEFLPGGEDLRVIVLNRRALGAMKRIAPQGAYLTNYSQGGIVENYDLTQDPVAAATALRAAEIFDLDYAGIDLMRDQKGQWRVLEVNRACQFQGFEKATGINVARKVVDFLVSSEFNLT